MANQNDALLNSITLELFHQSPSKSQRRKIQIIEAAVKTYNRLGGNRASYAEIGKAAGASQALVQHYFPKRTELFDLTVRYIRASFQRISIDAIQGKNHPRDQLEAYVRSIFYWIKKFPTHTRFWIHYYYSCSNKSKDRELNTDLVNMGHDRITALLERGKREKVFRCANTSEAAKSVQTILTGALIASLTENMRYSLEEYERIVINACFSVVGLETKR